MLRKWTRVFSIIITMFVLLGSLLVGCSPENQTTVDSTKNTGTTTEKPTATTSNSSEAPTVIRIMTQEHFQSLMSMDIETFQKLGEVLNITLEFEVTPSSEYAAKADLALSSKNYPELMHEGTNFQQYTSAGIFYDLTSYMDNKLSNYYQVFEEAGPTAIRNIKSDDGKFWYLAKFEGAPYRSVYYINQSWLDDLKLKVPYTIDELTEVLYAFKDAYPDKIAWAKGPWTGAIGGFYNVFGTSLWWFQPEEGSYVYGPVDRADELKAMLTWANQMWNDGILDRDYLTRDNDAAAALIQNKMSGFHVGPGDNAILWGEGGTEGSNFTSVGMLTYDSVKPILQPTNPVDRKFYLPVGAKAPIDKVLEMWNYLYSDEGIMLFAYGIEGKHYTMVNGQPQFTELITKHELGGVNGRRQFGINPNPFPHVSEAGAWLALGQPGDIEAYEYAKQFFTPNNPSLFATDEESAKIATISTDISKYVNESVDKFITGELNFDTDWNNFQARIQTIGFKEWQEVVMAQYTRWQNR